MALSRVKTWTSEILTASDLNAEFNNILNNALSLISPLTGNLDFGGYRATALTTGAAGNPSVQFTGDTDTGIFSAGANCVTVAAGGVTSAQFNSAAGAVNYAFFTPSATGDPPILDVEGTDGNIGLTLDTKGTGSLTLKTGGTARWWVDGTAGHLLATDNSFDIGASGATRPRHVYTSGSVIVGERLVVGSSVPITGSNSGDALIGNMQFYRFMNAAGTTSANFGIQADASNNIWFHIPDANQSFNFAFAGDIRGWFQAQNSGVGFVFNGESSADHAAPAANGCVIYTKDDGAGKTQLMARFNTGAAQQLAIEPP